MKDINNLINEMNNLGIPITYDNLLLDGKIHRVGKNKNGWYVGFNNPNNIYVKYGDWSNLEDGTHVWKQRINDNEAYRLQRIDNDRVLKEQLEVEREALLKNLRTQYLTFSNQWHSHPYAIKKQFNIIKNNNIKQYNTNLIVPVIDLDNNLFGFQAIDAHGLKRFGIGTLKKDNMFWFGKNPKDADYIFICEGVATASSVFQAMDDDLDNISSVATFDVGNIRSVVQKIIGVNKKATIVLVADNDLSRENCNIGVETCKSIVSSTPKIKLYIPQNNNTNVSTDANDIFVNEGKEVLAHQINDIINASVDNLLQYLNYSIDGFSFDLDTKKIFYKHKKEGNIIVSNVIFPNKVIIDKTGLFYYEIGLYCNLNNNIIYFSIPASSDEKTIVSTCNAKGAMIEDKICFIKYFNRLSTLINKAHNGVFPYENGWIINEKLYFYPNQSNKEMFIGNNKNHCIIDIGGNITRKINGSLQDWQDKVLNLCVENDMYMFAIMIALTGFIKKPLNYTESFGFHVYSHNNGNGKTSVAKLAASIIGDIQSGFNTWEHTSNSLELVCAKANDSLVVLDEIKNMKKYETLSGLLMKIFNGSGAGRMSVNVISSRPTFTWNIVCLSTGNYSVERFIKDTENRFTIGAEENRLLSIPMLPANAFHGHKNLTDFTCNLMIAINDNHGIVGHEFVVRLIDFMSNNYGQTLEKFYNISKTELENFIKEIGIIGLHERVISRFALVAVAGKMAMYLGIIPSEYIDVFDPIECVKNILKIYIDEQKSDDNNIDSDYAYYINKLNEAVANKKKFFRYPLSNNDFGNSQYNDPFCNYGYLEDNCLIITRKGFIDILEIKSFKSKDAIRIRDFLKEKQIIINDSHRIDNKFYTPTRGVNIDLEKLGSFS